MRLFLLAVGMWAVAGCASSDEGAGAVRVEIFYATFRPGCLTVTALDMADESHSETQELTVEERHSAAKTVAVFRKADWGRELRVTASAREGSCTGPEVATSAQLVQVPEKGTKAVYLDLRAEDLDDDGFVSASGGKGTDCDDSDATVHPGAAETCDGKDSNCSGDESDATDKPVWYTDADGDGYGNASQSVRACVGPAGSVREAGDCADADATVHPGQPELSCDNRDEDCDGTVDDDFKVGLACKDELGCAGTWVCSADEKSAECERAQSPMAWYVDADGDGRAGTLSALSCEAPVGAKSTPDDCDDGSRFIGGAEVCDWLDNDCNGSVDEDIVCLANHWRSRTVGGGAAWGVVTTYAQGKAWLAGAGGRLTRVDGATETDVTACGTGSDWTAAWARPSDGRVFLGSTLGRLATTSGADCDVGTAAGVSSTVTGLVGFERNGVTTVYAVTSSGHVVRWEWPDSQTVPSTPVVMQQVPARLRSIHGLGPDSLFAVGSESYQPGGADGPPRVFRLDTASGRWVLETLPAEASPGALNAVYVVGGGQAYAVGDGGLLLERHEGTWRKLPAPTGTASLDLLDVVAFDTKAVFVLSNKAGAYLHHFDGTAWSEPFPQAQALLSLDAIDPREQWAVGQGGTVVQWGMP